jgi:transcriptional regulator with XRE-family HTH domain
MKLNILRENLTKKETAKRLGIEEKTYANYENGKTEPNIATLCKIADYYGVTLDYLCEHQTNSFLDQISAEDRQTITDYLCLPEQFKAIIRGEIRTSKIAHQTNPNT